VRPYLGLVSLKLSAICPALPCGPCTTSAFQYALRLWRFVFFVFLATGFSGHWGTRTLRRVGDTASSRVGRQSELVFTRLCMPESFSFYCRIFSFFPMYTMTVETYPTRHIISIYVLFLKSFIRKTIRTSGTTMQAIIRVIFFMTFKSLD